MVNQALGARLVRWGTLASGFARRPMLMIDGPSWQRGAAIATYAGSQDLEGWGDPRQAAQSPPGVACCALNTQLPAV